MLGNIKIKEPTSKKITAYGFRKPGTKSIIHLLDEAQGYSRKLEVLERMAVKELKSYKKFYNGFQELKNIGFIKVINTNKSQQVKIDKRLWDRDLFEINIEHQLIQNHLNQSARWLSEKSLIRGVRNALELKTHNKQNHYALEVHLKYILTTTEYSKNENGLIRLSKFDGTSKEAITKNENQSNLFNFIPHTECDSEEKGNIPENEKVEIEGDEIDFDQDDDMLESLNKEIEEQDVSVIGNSIDHDIFGNSTIDDESDEPETNEPETNEPETNEAEAYNTTEENEEHSNNIISKDSPLEEIASKLKQIKHFAILESYCEISIIFNELKIIVEYDPSRHELFISSRYVINTNFLHESLRMFSKAEMIGQLAIETIKNVDYLILKHKTSVIRYDLQEIMSRVERIIYEAMQLQKLAS